MRKIDKGSAPESLQRWTRANPHGRYDQLSEVERRDIRNACTTEQFYLCAYCCQAISGNNTDTMNEHVEARDLAPNRTLDFSNIVASCTTPNQCDGAHGSRPLPLTPLMPECETELKFGINGRVAGLTERAKEAIRVLNLGDDEKHNKKLVEKRKQLSHTLLFVNGVDPGEGLEDEDLLLLVIEDLNTPKDGRLEPFAPVVANILKSWIAA